jgi:hypothetical protein
MYAVVVVTEENRSANKMLQANCEMTPEQGSDWLLVSFVLAVRPQYRYSATAMASPA